MTKCKQKLPWITFLLFCYYAVVSSEEVSKKENTKEDLTEAEAKDGQLEIIKTIKKINDDGSYTIGYEADDGSFKIESRDVLGNVKGTYGYVDEDGEIKRVSYTTTNFSDVVSEAPTVVQRIPKTNKTSYSPTRKPGILLYNPTTPSTPSSTSVIQAIPKRRFTTQSTTSTTPSTTTLRPDRSSYAEYVKNTAEVLRSTTTRPPNIIYATSLSPRQLHFPQRSLLRSTVVPHVEHQKSEGQIIRPEIVTGRPTELPAYRRLALKNPLLENESPTIKPVTEEPEVKGNLLRRQLSQEKTTTFDTRQHIVNLQQGLGDDSVDVYSASLTTGTPRPLFTTTHRPKTPSPAAQLITANSNKASTVASEENVQESTTTENTVTEATPPVSTAVYQIPPAHPLVALRHPFHGGVVLVPYNQIRQQEVNPVVNHHPQYVVTNNHLLRQTPTSDHTQNHQPNVIQRPQVLRSIPVHVDENGYVRPYPQQIITPTPYPMPISITPPPMPLPEVTGNGIENEVESIRPPVSTRDFQKLIELLILRQSRLEHVNALLSVQRQKEHTLQQRYRIAPTQSVPVPFFFRRPQAHEISQSGPVTFLPEGHFQRTRSYHPQHLQHQERQSQAQQSAYIVKPQTQESREVYVQESPITYTTAPTAFTPTKRVARLLHSSPPNEQDINNEYLPPQIREMLLLRMLQLAINPALPLDNPENDEVSAASEQQEKKMGVRNVEVLGEDTDDQKRPHRSKRFKEDFNNEYY